MRCHLQPPRRHQITDVRLARSVIPVQSIGHRRGMGRTSMRRVDGGRRGRRGRDGGAPQLGPSSGSRLNLDGWRRLGSLNALCACASARGDQAHEAGRISERSVDCYRSKDER